MIIFRIVKLGRGQNFARNRAKPRGPEVLGKEATARLGDLRLRTIMRVNT